MMTRVEAIRKIEYGLEMETTEQTTFGRLTVVSTEALKMALDALREQERERGEWVLVYREPTTKLEWHECSICKRMMHYYPWSERDNFCPCCGADMRPEGGAENA